MAQPLNMKRSVIILLLTFLAVVSAQSSHSELIDKIYRIVIEEKFNRNNNDPAAPCCPYDNCFICKQIGMKCCPKTSQNPVTFPPFTFPTRPPFTFPTAFPTLPSVNPCPPWSTFVPWTRPPYTGTPWTFKTRTYPTFATRTWKPFTIPTRTRKPYTFTFTFPTRTYPTRTFPTFTVPTRTFKPVTFTIPTRTFRPITRTFKPWTGTFPTFPTFTVPTMRTRTFKPFTIPTRTFPTWHPTFTGRTWTATFHPTWTIPGWCFTSTVPMGHTTPKYTKKPTWGPTLPPIPTTPPKPACCSDPCWFCQLTHRTCCSNADSIFGLKKEFNFKI